jgi:hypothetical protein
VNVHGRRCPYTRPAVVLGRRCCSPSRMFQRSEEDTAAIVPLLRWVRCHGGSPISRSTVWQCAAC